MKKFLLMWIVFVMCFMTFGNCSAINFSKSAELGNMGQYGPYGITIEGASEINAEKNNRGKTTTYLKGIARFGKSLYFYFDFKKNLSKFGGKNFSDAVSVYVLEGGTRIYKLQNDQNLEMYLFFTETGAAGSYKVIGKHKNGKWVTYFDTFDVRREYIGRALGIYLSLYSIQGDTMIFKYTSHENKFGQGEFRFKWDDAAQWFGVEQIKY